MIRVHQVKTTSSEPAQIKAALLRKLNMPLEDLIDWHIYRRSVDARKHTVTFSYTIDAKVHHEKKYLKNKDVIRKPNENYHFSPAGTIELANRPVVIGFGPAGMFAALVLSQEGYRPLIIERGSSLRKRQQDVDRFWKKGSSIPKATCSSAKAGPAPFRTAS